MKQLIRSMAIVGLISVGLGASAWAGESNESVSELLGILRERGVIDESDYRRLAVKNAAYEERQKRFLPKLEFSGDFRARAESFWFDRDATGFEQDNRYRGRYRLRIGVKTEINDYLKLLFRITTGQDDPRSTNQTLGSGVDFDPDGIFMDRGYLELRPFGKAGPPVEGGSLVIAAGKMPNPFRWKVGKDWMLWDGDVNPEGAAVRLAAKPYESLSLFANAGFFIIDENSSSKDPSMAAVQAGAEFAASDVLTLGGRLSYYGFSSLDENFVCRGFNGKNEGPLLACDGSKGSTSGGGNIRDGLTGNVGGGSFDVGELGLYLRFSRIENWPMLIYGNIAQNFDAQSSKILAGVGEEDMAYGIGIEVGDSKKWVKLGAGWWHVEANAFPSQFVDSDLFDGRTNREGFAFYGMRRILKNTDAKLTLFVSDSIEDDLPGFVESVKNAKRVRLQSDLVVHF